VTEEGAASAADAGESTGPDRRRVMMMGAAAGLGVAGVAALAGCGSDSTASRAAGAAAAAATTPTPGAPLAKLSDVPVGGVYAAAAPDGKPIIIAQPTAGQVVAFDAACTHAGCKVVANDKTLTCPCHNSTFDGLTGKNLTGPASTPLPAVAVKVKGTDIVAG
jgi:Rieske Fe-S protein